MATLTMLFSLFNRSKKGVNQTDYQSDLRRSLMGGKGDESFNPVQGTAFIALFAETKSPAAIGNSPFAGSIKAMHISIRMI